MNVLMRAHPANDNSIELCHASNRLLSSDRDRTTGRDGGGTLTVLPRLQSGHLPPDRSVRVQAGNRADRSAARHDASHAHKSDPVPSTDPHIMRVTAPAYTAQKEVAA